MPAHDQNSIMVKKKKVYPAVLRYRAKNPTISLALTAERRQALDMIKGEKSYGVAIKELLAKQLDPVVELQRLHTRDLIAGPEVKELIQSLRRTESLRREHVGTEEFIILCCELYYAIVSLAKNNDEWGEYLDDASLKMKKRMQNIRSTA